MSVLTTRKLSLLWYCWVVGQAQLKNGDLFKYYETNLKAKLYLEGTRTPNCTMPQDRNMYSNGIYQISAKLFFSLWAQE